MQNTMKMQVSEPAPTSIVLPRENDPQFSGAMRAAAIADDYMIDSAEMYELAAGELAHLRGLLESLEARRVSITGPLNQAFRAANALFKPAMDELDAAIKILISRMLAYTRAQQARIAAENAAREAAARAEREALEAEAKTAASAGNDEEAYAIRQTAAILTAPREAISAAAPKVSGISTRQNWTAECYDLPALIAWIAAHPENANLLMPNGPALTAMAKAQKSAMKIPGVRAFDKGSVAVRK